MTNLEAILIMIVWVGYGIFAAYQSDNTISEENKVAQYFFYAILSPIVFICKALYGAFKTYK